MSLHLVDPEELDESDPADPTDPADPAEDDLTDFGDAESDGTEPLFPGDIGELPRSVREIVVAILKRKYVSADRHPDLWQAILDNEPTVQSRLNDLFLELVINRDYRVALKKQAVSETGNKFPTLLYDKEWNREETIILVHLRRMIRTSQKAGDTEVFVDGQTLVEEVRHYQPRDATNQSGDDRRSRTAVDSLTKSEILLRTDTDDRYRVSPVIEVLLPVGRLKALGAWLAEQNGTSTQPPLSDTDEAGRDRDEQNAQDDQEDTP